MSRIAYGEVAKTILKVIGFAGALTVIAVAPGAVRLFVPSRRKRFSPPRREISRTLKRLKTAGMVKASIRYGKEHVELTKEGEELVSRIKAEELLLNPPKYWDQLWRVVMFDVREDRRRLRDRFRKWLRSNGFIRLQDSVWIYPFPCEEIVELVRTSFRMRVEVIYLTCKRFPTDRWLVKNLNLFKKIKKSIVPFKRGRD